MKKSGAPVADELENGPPHQSVRYFETRGGDGTKAGADVLKDIKVGEFDLKPPKYNRAIIGSQGWPASLVTR